MKHLKILGLAVVATAALMAFIGANSASATVLCKTTPVSPNTNSCPTGWDYPAETVTKATVENTIHFIAGSIDDTCTESTIQSKTASTGGATSTVSGPIEVLSYGGCTCPAKTITNGSLEIHWIPGSPNGTLTKRNSKVAVNCFGIICEYGTAAGGTDLGTITSSATSSSAATVDIEASLPRLGGNALFCPAIGELTGNYVITEPIPLYVAETG